MAGLRVDWGSMLLILGLILLAFPSKAAAFGAGNIPSIAQVEGHNFRHGDIEDVLATIVFLNGKKFSKMMIKRVYFGNWLRDYSQAVDIGSLKGANAETIRILVWVLSFMAHGYATAEFEVTADRLGVYRPEEHIDNPLGYGEGMDARDLDKRLRGPVDPIEVEIDPRTGMKNYIANEAGKWDTSARYLRHSFAHCIHNGRVYIHGAHGSRGKEENLCEALRYLGQALHCLEDFPAHSNYCELALRELGYNDVFCHCGRSSKINLHGRHVYPIVTGTFGEVDFLHSVLGEATDHFTQSEVDEMNVALKNAEQLTQGAGGNSRGFGFGGGGDGPEFIRLVSQLPGVGGGLADQARDLQRASNERERENEYSSTRDSANQVPGMSPNFDPVETVRKIYPILEFRDKVVKSISRIISKIPGLESLLEHISETLTAFILGLLAPFIRPIIEQVSKTLKDGSSTVIGASANSQFVVWDDPHSTNPTHSMLSKDHFTNILNGCAGEVASEIVKYAVRPVLDAWHNLDTSVDDVVNDILRTFHHPAIRDERVKIHRVMFKTVEDWVRNYKRRDQLNYLLSSQSVKDGKNHLLRGEKPGHGHSHSHGGGSKPAKIWDAVQDLGHGKVSGSLWSQVNTRDIDSGGGGRSGGESAQPHTPIVHTNPNYWDDDDDVARSASPASQPPPSPRYGYPKRNSPRPETEGGYLAPSPGYAPSQPSYVPPGGEPGYYGPPQPRYGEESRYGGGGGGYGPPQPQYGEESRYGGGGGGYGGPPQQQYGPPGGYPPPGPEYGPPGGYPGDRRSPYPDDGGRPPYPPGGYDGPPNPPYPY